MTALLLSMTSFPIFRFPTPFSVALCVMLAGRGLLPGAESGEPVEAALRSGWSNASGFLIDEANAQFSALEGNPQLSNANERERQLGYAVTLLNAQPRTRGNLQKAQTTLQQLAESQGNDEVTILATFFLARVHEMYVVPAQPDLAKRLYQRLLEKHPGVTIAERGAAALVLMDLYENISDEERGKRFETLETLSSRLQTSSGRRDYHLNMGNAYIHFPAVKGGRSRAIEHLQAADKEGITQWQVEAATWVAIGELARLEGQNDLAARYFEKFLAKYPRDNRHYTVSQRLQSLNAKE